MQFYAKVLVPKIAFVQVKREVGFKTEACPRNANYEIPFYKRVTSSARNAELSDHRDYVEISVDKHRYDSFTLIC